MRVVADSNIYVSALRFGGTPEKFLRAAEDRRYVLLVSEAILAETAEVCSRKFEWEEGRLSAGLDRIRALAEMTKPNLGVAACIDPDDDRILEAALAGSATHIVSGDKHLLVMGEFRGIVILKVAAFLHLLAASRETDLNA